MSDPDAKDFSDYKWLLARERGDDINHVLAADRAPYEKLGAIIGARTAPSAAWRQRVLDAIDAAELAGRPLPAPEPVPEPEPVPKPEPVTVEPAPAKPAPAKPATAPSVAEKLAPVLPLKPKPTPKPRRALWIAGGLATAAAAAALVYLKIQGSPAKPPDEASVIAMETTVRPGPTVVRADRTRGDDASIGDTLLVRAEVAGPAEIRVYGGSGERLIAQCNDRAGCTVERDGDRRRFTLEVLLTAPGTVRAVIFVGADLPPSTRSLTPDLEAAAAAKIPHVTRTPTLVL
jgi:hypothetical protein